MDTLRLALGIAATATDGSRARDIRRAELCQARGARSEERLCPLQSPKAGLSLSRDHTSALFSPTVQGTPAPRVKATSLVVKKSCRSGGCVTAISHTTGPIVTLKIVYSCIPHHPPHVYTIGACDSHVLLRPPIRPCPRPRPRKIPSSGVSLCIYPPIVSITHLLHLETMLRTELSQKRVVPVAA